MTPDLGIYSRQPLDVWHDIIRRTDPPLVTVEILSPMQGTYPVMEKVEHYLNSGEKTCWVVNPPARTITIYQADGTDRTFLTGQQAVDPAIGISANVTAVFFLIGAQSRSCRLKVRCQNRGTLPDHLRPLPNRRPPFPADAHPQCVDKPGAPC